MNNIGWCDETINPIVGCSKCSPGCDNCYAEGFAARLAKNPATAKKYAGVVDENGKWTGCLTKMDFSVFDKLPRKPQRIFVGSMTDMFHPALDARREDMWKLLNVFWKNLQHTFLFLTKRPDKMQEIIEWLGERDGGLPKNVWLGVTVCNQAEADAKIPVLLQIPEAKRFVSVEPCLGPVDLDAVSFRHSPGFLGSALRWHHLPHCRREELENGKVYPALDWVICGGETGPGARPMHPEWARSLRDQCQSAGVPFYFKGWGEWRAGDMSLYRFAPSVRRAILKSGLLGIPSADMYRIGKKRAGCLIDGQEWHQFPGAL